MENQSNRKLTFNGTSVIQNNKNIIVLVYMKPGSNEQYLNYNNQHQRKKKKTKVLFPPCLIEHVPLLPRTMS